MKDKGVFIQLMRIKGSNEFSTSPAVHGWETKYISFSAPFMGFLIEALAIFRPLNGAENWIRPSVPNRERLG